VLKTDEYFALLIRQLTIKYRSRMHEFRCR